MAATSRRFRNASQAQVDANPRPALVLMRFPARRLVCSSASLSSPHKCLREKEISLHSPRCHVVFFWLLLAVFVFLYRFLLLLFPPPSFFLRVSPASFSLWSDSIRQILPPNVVFAPFPPSAFFSPCPSLFHQTVCNRARLRPTLRIIAHLSELASERGGKERKKTAFNCILMLLLSNL